MTTHLEWDRLNDFADGRLTGDVATGARVHLATCADCRAAVESIRELAASARGLPPEVDPPDALWRDVAATIAAGGGAGAASLADAIESSAPAAPVVPVASVTSSAPRTVAAPTSGRVVLRPARVMPSARWIAAAAVLLMALSSGVTALFMRRDAQGSSPVVAAGDRGTIPTVAPAGTTPALPAAFVATEAAYLDDVAELQATFSAQRPTLAPATIAVVERSLAAIDAAITEARTALLADPANQALAELLASSYRHKVELLRRAAESSQSL